MLSDESTARVVLEDWLHDYYDIDDGEAEPAVAGLCAPVLTDEAMGLSVEADVEIAAEYLYAAAYDEN